MDNDLSRSVRLLDESVVATNRRAVRHAFSRFKRKEFDLSVSFSNSEVVDFMGDTTNYTESFHTFLDENKTLTGSVIRASEPWKNTTDSLYQEFYELLQTHADSNDVLNIVAQMSRCCSDSLNVVRGLKSKVTTVAAEDQWLENERNTWRLLYVLYGNRLNSPEFNEDEFTDYYGRSEKYCMLSLFKKDSLVREIQLVIDWLECNAAQKDDEVLHFSPGTIGWENTLHQLKSKDTIVFGASRKIVQHMDPDAQHYEHLPLHDLDMEDDMRLRRKVFALIRCGKLGEGQLLYEHCGHFWRSCQLDGWKLYHNPQLHDDFHKEFEDIDYHSSRAPVREGQPKPVEGNQSRDIWKEMAWKYCALENLDKYARAAFAAYSGNLNMLLSVCDNWEDYLWSYMRVMMDIRVETDLREKVAKEYKPMPQQYWDQRMSINEIFDALHASSNATVKRESQTEDHVIQKYIILDEIEKLVDLISEWVVDPSVSPQFLRFLTHLVMFLETIGQTNNREVVETVLEEYIKRLMEMRHTELIAYYVSKLGEQTQIQMYSSYLETIIEKEERYRSLEIGEDCGLNIYAVSKQVVENIRARHEVSLDGDLQQKLTKLDEFKISALDWLYYNENQISDALIQTNALIFQFLTLKKLDAAQLAFNKLPADIVQKIHIEEDLKDAMRQCVKEYLSYKAYLDAQESFNEWFKHFKARPLEPQSPAESAQFTEKVAYEHRLSQHKAETGRWKLMMGQLSKLAKAALYNVLLFPDDGWLSDAKDAIYLRSVCIPECTMLLYTVLYNCEMYEECVQLADIIASEAHKLYEVYTSEKMGELFQKLNECSVALLEQKKDPWGNEMSA